jgi:hypothetical protein
LHQAAGVCGENGFTLQWKHQYENGHVDAALWLDRWARLFGGDGVAPKTSGYSLRWKIRRQRTNAFRCCWIFRL